jgi:hypothetical protein
MFSTKVIITKKEDFIEFLDILIENGYYDMAFNYLENALNIFPIDKQLRQLFEKLSQKTQNKIDIDL